MPSRKPKQHLVLAHLEGKTFNDTFILPKGERLFWILLVYVGSTFLMLPLIQWWIADPTTGRTVMAGIIFLLWCWWMMMEFFPSGIYRSPGSREYLTFEGNNLLTYLRAEPRTFSKSAWISACDIVVLEYSLRQRSRLGPNLQVSYEVFQQKQVFNFYVADPHELLLLENVPSRLVVAIPKLLGGPIVLKKDLSNINVTEAEKLAIFQAIASK